MDPDWILDGNQPIPTTLMLKNAPDALNHRHKATAKAHRRSLNQEAILCPESAMAPCVIEPHERLARIRTLGNSLGAPTLSPEEIDQLKRQGT